MVEETQPEGVDPSQQEDQREDQQEEEQTTSDEADPELVKEQLEEALREKDQFRAMGQRAQADLVNYRRRAAEEQEELRRSTNSRLLLKVLGVIDDLDRALALVPGDAVAPGWLDGLQLVKRNLDNLIETEGVIRIESEGQPFEPWEHEAVFYQETPDKQEGMVVDVVRQGYKLHGKVLRAAQVIVSKATQPEKQEEEAKDQEA